MYTVVDSAKLLAHRAHLRQERRYSNEPYIKHPTRVAASVAAYPGHTEEMIAAAWLHDVVEDTEWTIEEVEFSCNFTVAKLVYELTNPPKDPLLCRADRKKMDRNHLAQISREAKIIKMFDRIDNLQDIGLAPGDFMRLYCEESQRLLPLISDADPSLGEELQLIIDTVRWLSIC